jgi:drug/metabolite transporter (DMT)-like permease
MLSQALGNIVATRNFRAGLPILETAALGMVYGAAASLVISLALGGVPAWSFSPGFLAGYLWVAVVGTAVAFMCYLVLLGRIGPERVAYIVVVVPVVALIVSTIFEGYEWTVLSSAGAAVVLFGSVLALTTPRTAPAAAGSAP